MTPLAAYLLLFVAVGIGFIFGHLMIGKVIRPNKPYPAKRTIYECGEPTIGSSWIQFDLRFYVVALLFVIFDVEVAFFFPWAVVFGKANALASLGRPTSAAEYKDTSDRAWELVPPAMQSIHVAQHKNLLAVTDENVATLSELRQKIPPMEARVKNLADKENPTDEEKAELDKEKALLAKAKVEFAELELGEQHAMESQKQGRLLAWMALVEIAVFFGVLLVGYAYLWRRGDLAWVRSLAAERSAE